MARYHPSGESAFSPAQRTTVPGQRGRIGTHVKCLTRMARFSPTDAAFELPRPVTNVAGIYRQKGNAGLFQNLALKLIVLQIFSMRSASKRKSVPRKKHIPCVRPAYPARVPMQTKIAACSVSVVCNAASTSGCNRNEKSTGCKAHHRQRICSSEVMP